MLIANASTFMPDCTFRPGALRIDDDRITELGPKLTRVDGEAVLDAEGMLAVPGLIDIHLHGAMGTDFCEGTVEAIQRIADAELSQGVTAFLAANMAQPYDVLLQICEAAGSYTYERGAEFLGINMEAPYISQKKRGAQNPEYLADPNVDEFLRLQKAARGLIKIVTIAPERRGSDAFIRGVRGMARVSLGHSGATYEQAAAAVRAGANHVTHLCNAMSPLSHHDTGIIGAAWEAPHCFAELIAEPSFVSPPMLRAMMKLYGLERIALISDSMPCAGMPDGIYSVGGDEIVVANGVGSMARDGALAGPARTLMGLVRGIVEECGVSLEDAIQCATRTPARALGIDHLYGSLLPGRYADVVLLDRELNVRLVMMRGQIAHDYRPRLERAVEPSVENSSSRKGV